MLENTWKEEPDMRPSFSDIVCSLSKGVEDTSDDITIVRVTNEPDDYVDVKES